jgi:hypothetical protein
VLIPGDLMGVVTGEGRLERERREHAKLRALFAGLLHRPRLGFLMVRGDCELRESSFEDCGVRMLSDEVVAFPDERLQVIGLSPPRSRHRIVAGFLDAAREFSGLTIVFGHAPEFSRSAPDSSVPLLCLAGTRTAARCSSRCSGPDHALERPARDRGGGLHRLGDSWVCVSRGIGWRGTPRRGFGSSVGRRSSCSI